MPLTKITHQDSSDLLAEDCGAYTEEINHIELSDLVSGNVTQTARALAARRLGELPHMLIGGVDSQSPHIPVESESTCGIDWLAGSFPLDVFDELVEYVNDIYQIEPEFLDRGRYVYDQRISYDPYGCNIYYDSTKERADRLHRGRFSIEFTGSGLQMFTANGLYKLVYDLILKFKGRLSRIDLAYDDHKRRICPYEIAEYAADGLYTGFRSHTHIAPRKRNGELTGDTLYFGSRGSGSGKFLRIYDKYLESGGKIDCIRYEVQFEKDKAKRIGAKLAACGTIEEFAAYICGLIGGSIDFIERKDKNLDRNARLDWWQVIIDMMGQVILRNPVRVETVDKTISFFERLSASMAMVKHAIGDDSFNEFIQEMTAIDEADLPERHKRLLDNYRILEEVPF